MDEGNADDHPMELEKVDLECDDIMEISTTLIEKTTENKVEPDVEDSGRMIEDSHSFVVETTDKTVDTEVCLEGDKDSTMVAEETVPKDEGDRLVSYPADNLVVVTSVPAKNFKVPSRYLSGPYVSCHDFCKYGHHGNSEEKAKGPLLRTISNCRALGETTSLVESKRKSILRRLSFPGTKAERQNASLVQGIDLSPKHKKEPKGRRIGVRSNPSSPPTLSRLSCKQNAELKAEKKLNLSGSLSQKHGKGVGSAWKGDGKSTGPDSASVSKKPSIKKAASMNPRLYRNLDGLPRIRKLNGVKEPEAQRPADVPEKTLYMIEPSDEHNTKRVADSATHDESLSPSPKRKQVSKTKASKGSSNGIRNSRLLSMSTKSTSSKMRNLSQPERGEQEASERVNSKQNDSVVRVGMAKDTKLIAKSNVQLKEKVKRVDVSQSAAKGTSTRKLKFRRGKTVVLPSLNSIPKKIIFKKGKTLSENQQDDVEARTISLKVTEDVDNKPQETKVDSKKVVLRHQETASGPRDSLNLNNVIEETASELVKTRKSKVKALVGAFESVMFLRNHKTADESSAS